MSAHLLDLSTYCTNLDQPVFALHELPEEVVAVLFAYYSRSPLPLRDNLRRVLAEDLALMPGHTPTGDGAAEYAAAEERARAFHEKWVVGYGHGSVAEHAVVHLAVEEISIVASKALEDCRLASYTEKSTRYVPFDTESYVREPTIAAGPLASLYDETCRDLLSTYGRVLAASEAAARAEIERPAGWTQARYDSVCRSQACDVARYLLPAATRTNLGLTINARSLEHTLTKLYSDDLGEIRELAGALHREAAVIVPTLVKYAAPNAHLRGRRAAVEPWIDPQADAPPVPATNPARLVAGPAEPLSDVAAAILFEAGAGAWTTLRTLVAAWPAERQAELLTAYLRDRERFDAPGRALEQVTFSFELTLDYGAYRDVQRHRMCTQLGQVLDCRHGYETPPGVAAVGLVDDYHRALAASEAAWERLAEAHGPAAAQYVLPLAWRKRLLMTANLREWHHFISLRSGRQGHPSYRRVAQDCWHELHRAHPALAAGIRVDLADYDQARA
ncbi:MAG TPA: FAD-dependent thymidylate synthase [Armatimonadetes bacterium]|nr:FAD-dependent thymidylate synthase [Armatimonadota bacterium]